MQQGRKLRALYRLLGWSRTDCGKFLHVTERCLRNWERGLYVSNNVQAALTIKNILTEQVLEVAPDVARQTIFLEGAQTYALTKDPDTGVVTRRLLTPEEKQNLKPDPTTGKIAVATNGIYNSLDEATQNTMQNDPGKNTVYLVYFPKASNAFAELLVAGYQRFMENNFFGLSNATTQINSYIQQYGASGLTLDGHSRGAMTIGNGMQSLSGDPNMAGVMSNTNINLFGSAYNAQNIANSLNYLSGGTQNSVSLQSNVNDFVSRLIGGNEVTYGSTPPGSSTIGEWINMLGGNATAHNCYGAGHEGCKVYGTPVTTTIKANN